MKKVYDRRGYLIPSEIIEHKPVKKDKVKIAQGERSRELEEFNHFWVWLLCAEGLCFSELLRISGFSKKILMKHLRELRKNDFVYKDTIKSNETSNSQEIGRIVYRIKGGKCWSVNKHIMDLDGIYNFKRRTDRLELETF